ncbi:hypothetical protein GCM10011575_25650 [Microlunatus endophyticus]|uniref:Uncharacterized protein n=1 Tax=Microlunatus endophyticus TaxID=1716077 RepID=A0A917S9W2_9ACTN|nr:hypothetical protein GCM10011575_25650 [Microlunatus endophyticus]
MNQLGHSMLKPLGALLFDCELLTQLGNFAVRLHHSTANSGDRPVGDHVPHYVTRVRLRPAATVMPRE